MEFQPIMMIVRKNDYKTKIVGMNNYQNDWKDLCESQNFMSTSLFSDMAVTVTYTMSGTVGSKWGVSNGPQGGVIDLPT